MKKQPVAGETYMVRELLGCGAGHFMGRNFTHWEQGECCPLGGHDEGEDPQFLVPKFCSDEKTDLWDYLGLPENENKMGQFPLAEA
jgi:hypothetical protein